MDKQKTFTTLGAVLLMAFAITSRSKAFAAPPPVERLAAASESAAPAQPLSVAERSLRSFIDTQTRALNESYPGRVEVMLGSMDARRNLAPCARVEPFMAPGARLWGRSNIGLRCREGANWTTYLPIEVRIYGMALIAARPLSAGQVLAPEDSRLEEIELTREPIGVASDPLVLEGKIVTRAVAVGVALRAEWLRGKPVIASGDAVKLVYLGSGFEIVADAKALQGAAEGQSVRVQVESGRVLTGTARDGRRVEVR
jgi:flagellar basal body P-ring formation protein FlgA